MSSFIDNDLKEGIFDNKRSHNYLDGGAPFYRCYECAGEEEYMAVGR